MGLPCLVIQDPYSIKHIDLFAGIFDPIKIMLSWSYCDPNIIGETFGWSNPLIGSGLISTQIEFLSITTFFLLVVLCN